MAARGAGGKGAKLDAPVLNGVVALWAPLPSGESVNVQFLLGVQQTRTFRFYIVIEALP